MKKIVSAIVSAILIFSMIPVSAVASAGDSIVLSADNFTFPTAVNDTQGLGGKLLFANHSMKVQHNQTFPTARFYVQTTGTYKIWVLSGAAAADDARKPKIDLDGTAYDAEYSNDVLWHSVGSTHTVAAGWHTITLKTQADWKPYFLNAVLITTDASYTPTVDTHGTTGDNLAQFNDSVAPAISDADVEKSFSGNTLSMKFPTATDNSGTVYYQYTVGSVTKNISDISSFVEIGEIYGDTNITLTALDKHGNKAEKTFTVSAPTFELNSNGFLFTYKNFSEKPAFANGGEVDSGANAVADKSIKINGGDTSLSVTARFYVETEGDYALWLLSGNSDGIDKRHAKAYIDDAADQSSFNATNVLRWDKGSGADGGGKYHLAVGWHTVKVGLSDTWAPFLLNAVYITDDLSFTMSDGALKEIEKKQYDVTKPTVKSAFSASYTDGTSAVFTMPVFQDDSSVAETKLYVNDEEKIFSDTLSFTGLKPLDEVKIKAVATDTFGNSTKYETVYVSSPVQAAGFELKKGSTAISDISALSAGDTLSLNAKLTNAGATEQKVVLYICLLTNGGKKMSLCSEKKVFTLNTGDKDVTAEASIILPAGFDPSDAIIQATLWNDSTNEPFITAAEIKEAE